MVGRESATDYAVPYFKELVDGALSHQRLTTNELTAFYLVHLLASFLRTTHSADDVHDATPLALRLAHALETSGLQQRVGLRAVGDQSLFVSGFFSDSLRRKLVDVDYYVAIGGSAYQALSRLEGETFAPVFAELAGKFSGFVDVLMEVSERTCCTSNADLLRLYEKWLKTGSRHSAQLLVERGVVPNVGSKTTRVQ
jgi:hypothetical protein